MSNNFHYQSVGGRFSGSPPSLHVERFGNTFVILRSVVCDEGPRLDPGVRSFVADDAPQDDSAGRQPRYGVNLLHPQGVVPISHPTVRLFAIALLIAVVATALPGCAPLGLRIPWGIQKLPWTIAYLDADKRLTITTPTDKRQLFDQPLAEKGAAASPSGAHVAVVTDKGQLWIVPLIVGDPVKLTDAPVASDFWPDVSPWSHDGRALVYVSHGNVFYQRLAHRAKQLSNTGDAFTAALSPDGSRVAYGRKDTKEKDLGLWVVDTRGEQQPRELVDATGDVFSACCPTWSPDGQWIAFMQAYEGGALGVTKADGTDTRVGIEAAWQPLHWLPDNDTLLYPRVPFGDLPDGLWTYSVSGKQARALLEKGQDVQYALSPDATRALLAISKPSANQPPTQSRLSIINAATGTPEPEKQTVAGQVLHVYWSPKGDMALLSVIKDHTEMLASAGKLSDFRSLGEASHGAGWVHYK